MGYYINDDPQEDEFGRYFAEAMDLCGEEDTATVVATAAMESGMDVESTYNAIGGIL